METKITLYHGSNVEFSTVDLAMSKDKRDFGKGFYMTTIKNQAYEWAVKQFKRFGGDGISVYEFELSVINDLKIKKFDNLSREWLEFIIQNRTKGGAQHSFDIIQGPVANDNTFETIADYVLGTYSVYETLDRLRYMKPNDQVSIHTGRALPYLRLIRREQYDK
ncbi:MAG: DUF3990 domain-containing protein [Termitinemataceae bacterium]|nr:MAG: DUF3990 domain-containing protein [Termitinemataceae bacterium]